jgi:hypothetical protein
MANKGLTRTPFAAWGPDLRTSSDAPPPWHPLVKGPPHFKNGLLPLSYAVSKKIMQI